MTISDSTLATNVWDDIRTALVAASIVTTIGATTTSANITNAYPDKFVTKPTIVLNPVVTSRGGFAFGGVYGDSMINVVIELYSDKTLAIDQMTNQVNSTLLPNTITGINLIEVNEDYSFSSPEENKMHLKTMTFVYQRTSHA
jgi:hypothetical protein